MKKMRLFHKHKWKEIARTQAEPRNFKVERFSMSAMEKVALGVTTILWECETCQETRKEEMLGKEVLEKE